MSSEENYKVGFRTVFFKTNFPCRKFYTQCITNTLPDQEILTVSVHISFTKRSAEKLTFLSPKPCITE